MIAMQLFLLAQHSRLDAMSDGFRSHDDSTRDELLLGLLILAVVGAGVWAATRLATGPTMGQRYDNPWQLFHALCKAHGLGWTERHLLKRMATLQGLKDPARIFLEADRWEPNRLPHGIRHEFTRLSALQKRLFEMPVDVNPGKPATKAGEKLPEKRLSDGLDTHDGLDHLESSSVASAERNKEVMPLSKALAVPREAPLLPRTTGTTLDLPK
jgi:hypothetical protein